MEASATPFPGHQEPEALHGRGSVKTVEVTRGEALSLCSAVLDTPKRPAGVRYSLRLPEWWWNPAFIDISGPPEGVAALEKAIREWLMEQWEMSIW
jgi:hypothetical protein